MAEICAVHALDQVLIKSWHKQAILQNYPGEPSVVRVTTHSSHA